MCEIMEKIRKEGWEEATSRINKLHSILLKNKRYEDLERSTLDPQYQEELMAELLPQND